MNSPTGSFQRSRGLGRRPGSFLGFMPSARDISTCRAVSRQIFFAFVHASSSGGVEPEAIAITESETYQTLLARAQRRTGGVPPERIVRHVLSVTHGADWPARPTRLNVIIRRPPTRNVLPMARLLGVICEIVASGQA